MKITFFKTQKDLAKTVNEVIDSYWNGQLTEKHTLTYLKNVFENNKDKAYQNGEFSAVLRQRCGKKRLELIHKILNK